MAFWQFIFFLPFMCGGINYYFSSSSGNDLNNGTMMQSPWKSFSKITTVTIHPGDSILLKSNDIFTEQLFLKNIHATGSNPVKITTYTTDPTPYYHRAIINKQDNANITNSTILCVNCQGIIISYLELCHSHFGIAIVYEMQVSNVYDILIENNYFHNINGNGFPNTSEWWGAAVTTGQNTNNNIVSIYNLNITHNFCNESDTFFKSDGYTLYHSQLISGVIDGNTMTYNYYNIIPLGNVMYNFSIINNIFLHNKPIKHFDKGTTDLIIVRADNMSNVINNEFGYRGEWNTSKDGCSIDFESDAFGTNVINNYFHNSYAAGIMVYGHPWNNQLSQDLNLNNNIFVEDGCYQTSLDHGSIAFMWPNTTGIVQNSIFIRCQNNLSVPIFWDSNNPQNLETWKFINNTIYNTTDNVVDNPIITYNQRTRNNYMDINAKCGKNVQNDCIIRYTCDGSKPTTNSMKYTTTLSINVTTPVFFKAFKNNLIESAAVGKIIAF